MGKGQERTGRDRKLSNFVKGFLNVVLITTLIEFLAWSLIPSYRAWFMLLPMFINLARRHFQFTLSLLKHLLTTELILDISRYTYHPAVKSLDNLVGVY